MGKLNSKYENWHLQNSNNVLIPYKRQSKNSEELNDNQSDKEHEITEI